MQKAFILGVAILLSGAAYASDGKITFVGVITTPTLLTVPVQQTSAVSVSYKVVGESAEIVTIEYK